MDRDEVVVSKNAKITWPIFNHLDRTRLVNKGFLSHDDKQNFFAELTREIPFCPLGLPECSQDLRDVAFSDLLRDVSAIFQTDSFSEFLFPLSSRIQEIWP